MILHLQDLLLTDPITSSLHWCIPRATEKHSVWSAKWRIDSTALVTNGYRSDEIPTTTGKYATAKSKLKTTITICFPNGTLGGWHVNLWRSDGWVSHCSWCLLGHRLTSVALQKDTHLNCSLLRISSRAAKRDNVPQFEEVGSAIGMFGAPDAILTGASSQ